MAALFEINQPSRSAVGARSSIITYRFLEGGQSERLPSRKIFRIISQVGSDVAEVGGISYQAARQSPPSWVDHLYDSQGLVPVPSGPFGRATREPPVSDYRYSYHLGSSGHHMPTDKQGLYDVGFRPDVDVLFLDSTFWRSCGQAGNGDFPSVLGLTTSQLELVEAVALEPENFYLTDLDTPPNEGRGLHDVFALVPNIKEILVIGALILQDHEVSQLGDGASGYMANSDCISRDQLEAWGFERFVDSPVRRGRPAVDETAETLWKRWQQMRAEYARPDAMMAEMPRVTKWIMAHDGSAQEGLQGTALPGPRARSRARPCPSNCIVG